MHGRMVGLSGVAVSGLKVIVLTAPHFTSAVVTAPPTSTEGPVRVNNALAAAPGASPRSAFRPRNLSDSVGFGPDRERFPRLVARCQRISVEMGQKY